MKDVVFFYSGAKNIQIGQGYLLQGRGQGCVIGVWTANGSYVREDGQVISVEQIAWMCVYFGDHDWGLCLKKNGEREGQLPGWGTYQPTGHFNEEGKRQWRSVG